MEALAIIWACDKFSKHALGRKFDIETNHKPLVPLLSSKHLDTLLEFPPPTSATGWSGTIIPSSTFPVDFSIPLICCPEH